MVRESERRGAHVHAAARLARSKVGVKGGGGETAVMDG